MKITFIQPRMLTGKPSDCMEPLVFALLKALTPEHIDICFYDERLESVPFDEPTDAVALTINTFTARRAYEIAQTYESKNIPVIAGGFHATLLPEEVLEFVRTVVVGDAEDTWPRILDDLLNDTLQERYFSTMPPMCDTVPDRSLFKRQRYLPILPVQFGRGCPHQCDFCSIHAVYDSSLRQRNLDDLCRELAPIRGKHILLTDDNLLHNKKMAENLFIELKNIGLRWSCQISINAIADKNFIAHMAESGCTSVTIGFESLNTGNLRQMNKNVNQHHFNYSEAIHACNEVGIMVYGTFVFGYDHDTKESFNETLDFALAHNLFLANFNPLTPFPGTRLYDRLMAENRMIYKGWWLKDDVRYGQAVFHPRGMTADELEEGCFRIRTEFNTHRNTALRFIRNKTNRKSTYNSVVFLSSNRASRKEIRRKQGKIATWTEG